MTQARIEFPISKPISADQGDQERCLKHTSQEPHLTQKTLANVACWCLLSEKPMDIYHEPAWNPLVNAKSTFCPPLLYDIKDSF